MFRLEVEAELNQGLGLEQGLGHPDILCDQVSGAILEARLTVDPLCKVVCEHIVSANCRVASEEGCQALNAGLTTHGRCELPAGQLRWVFVCICLFIACIHKRFCLVR